jgi:hypothetical protein
MTSALEANRPKKYIVACSIFLDGIALIYAILILQMQIGRKSSHSNIHSIYILVAASNGQLYIVKILSVLYWKMREFYIEIN